MTGSASATAPRAWACFVAIASALAVVHGRDVAFGFTSLDDVTLLVQDEPFLSSPGAVWRAFGRTYFHVVDAAHAYYRPLVTASYAIDRRAFGGAAAGYHLTNVLLHLAATWLVFVLLVRTKVDRFIALGAALLFAVHPAVVPSVAWIPGRNDSLVAIFVLAAIISHARACAASVRSGAWRAAHVASFALAMLAKETAIVVPLLCVAWSRLVVQENERARGRRDAIATWVGWAGVIGAYVCARHRVLAGAALDIDWRAPFRHFGLLVSSAGKILVPVDLAPIAMVDAAPPWIGLVAILTVTGVVVSMRRRGAAPRMRVLAFGGTLYVLALLPSLFVVQSLALENRLYLPAVGVLIVLAELAACWSSRANVERRVGVAFGSVTALAFASLSFGYASAYRDPLTFAKAAVAAAPGSSLARFTLGQARQLRGELDVAVTEYAYALALNPSEPIVRNNLAVIYMKQGDLARAEETLEAELRVNPGYATAIENLALVRRKRAR